MNEIIVAIISGAALIITEVLTIVISSNKTRQQLETQQAVSNTKIEELTREVREHNGFARRMPVVEEQIKVINHRLADLEKREHDEQHH